jgi:hypothetical protein
MFELTIRSVLFAGAAVVALAGLVGAAAGFGWSALWVTIGATVVLVALIVERSRYRSDAADATFEPVGPGGGEPLGALEPRFRRTDETFIDPTTGHLMRVHLDARTGERRYLAEG